MTSGVHEFPVRGQRFIECFDHLARVQQFRLDLEHVTVGFCIAHARGHGLGAPLITALRQCRRQCLHAQPRVGAQVVARHFLALVYRDGIDVDVQHFRLAPELAPAAGVKSERAADHDDEVGLRQVLEPDLGREAARDAHAVRVVVEQSPRGQ